jgi:hypothetical protein
LAKIRYVSRSFNPTALDVIRQAEVICNTYAAQGYSLTLRQLYYRFIATDALPESRRDPASGTKNTEKNYKWLGSLISDARLAGLIDWNHVEDRGREKHGGDSGWGHPRNIIRYGANNYSITHWDGQENYVEIWVEKQAIEDVVARPAGRWNVGYFACKGYVSQSSMHEAALRIREQEDDGKTCTIIHLGDHDPSGIDMTRDIKDRMYTFGANVDVVRIALNMDQVEAYDPPPSPAKITDSRARDYIEIYGDDSWELDALEPATLESLIEDHITSRLDMDLYDERIQREARERSVLSSMHANYDTLLDYMRDNDLLTHPEDDN